MKNKTYLTDRPTLKQVKSELKKERYRSNYRKAIGGTLSVMLVAASISVLIATLFFPTLKIYGGSMEPTLVDGDIVVTVRTAEFEQGDLIAFYYNNKILVKRVIGSSGDWINIDEDGNVTVNGEVLEEDYLVEKALGTCDIELPYQVPDGRYFVMGDHRSTSIDSRSTKVGCVSEEMIVGKLSLLVWPISSFGFIQ